MRIKENEERKKKILKIKKVKIERLIDREEYMQRVSFCVHKYLLSPCDLRDDYFYLIRPSDILDHLSSVNYNFSSKRNFCTDPSWELQNGG